MARQKLSADCDNELLDSVKNACKMEKRSVANFVRIACQEKAQKILGVKK